MGKKKVIEIDFPPNVKVRWGHGNQKMQYIENIFKEKIKNQLEFIIKMEKYVPFFEKIDIKETNETSPFWVQNWFPPLDGMSLYSMLSEYKPETYIEIGSGNSTKFACQAIKDQFLNTSVTSIDPFPRAEIDNISDHIIREGLETVDVTMFDSLQENDVIFFDGSHRCFQNSDVTVFFIDILPRLKKGVIVGIHDIFLPDDYPAPWLDRYYNEQYVLATHILAKNSDFNLLFACNWLAKNYSTELQNYASDKLKANLKEAKKEIRGGCCWFRT